MRKIWGSSYKCSWKNGYPIEFIFCNINKCLNILIRHKHNNTKEQDTNSDNKRGFFVLTYDERITKNLQHLSIQNHPPAFCTQNTFKKFIRTPKDKIRKEFHNNIIYKINCNNCTSSYVGQTKRLLKTRIKEHKQHINKDTQQTSVITDHRLNYTHDFDWEHIMILDEEPNYFKRLISEAIHIKKQIRPLNLQQDTEIFNDMYSTVINTNIK